MTALCFVDCETSGLGPDDEIWEFAGRRREPDGTVEECHLFIFHDIKKPQHLPTSFFKDYRARLPRLQDTTPRHIAATIIQRFTLGAHLVGANPAFDAEKLGILLRAYDLEPHWHYHLIDIEALILGYLTGAGATVNPPWKSEDLSKKIGVDPANFERHTALGDVAWVEAQWDVVFGG